MQLAGAVDVIHLYGTDLKPGQEGLRRCPESPHVQFEKITPVIALLFLNCFQRAKGASAITRVYSFTESRGNVKFRHCGCDQR